MSNTYRGPSFYWYDFETFGLHRRKDRPAQFAGMRTDMAFNPVSQGEVLYAKPSTDYLPKPESCLVTGITPQECQAKGMAESEFAGEIWSKFNQPETISIGYNTLGFDDEVSRFLFWRNFLDPYSHQWKNGCSRWDIFPLICAVWALRGNGIQWPLWKDVDPNNQERDGVCFKLEYLSQANGITHTHAHDALSDVEATLGLAKLIQQTEPRLWQWALDNRTKAAVKAAVEKGPVVWVSPKFGQKHGFIRLASMISINAQKTNEVFMWDLMHDPEKLARMSAAELKSRLLVRRDSLSEGVEPLPVYRLLVNSSPFVCSALKVVTPERAEKFGLDLDVARQNHAKLQAILPMLQGALLEFSENQEKPMPSDVDYGLYDGGFASREDASSMDVVRRSSPERLADLTATRSIHFEDERLNTLLFRFRARNWPDTLTAKEAQAWRAFCQARLMDGQDDALTIADFFDEIDRLQENSWDNEAHQAVLEALYEWGEQLGEYCAS